VEGLIVDAAQERVPIISNGSPIRAASGEVIGGIMTAFDVRRLKELEQDTRAAYAELAHRVKNHLQIMSAIIVFDARGPNISAKELASRCQGHLKILAAVYDGMALAGAGERIIANEFLDLVCRPYRTATLTVEVQVQPNDLTLSSDLAAPLGLLVNEAVCNSYKHAFPTGAGMVRVSVNRDELDRLVVEVADDGIGLPPGTPRAGSQGILFMRLQAEKLRGHFEVSGRAGGGTAVRMTAPAL
jgi:two-component sensor histidine kinase